MLEKTKTNVNLNIFSYLKTSCKNCNQLRSLITHHLLLITIATCDSVLIIMQKTRLRVNFLINSLTRIYFRSDNSVNRFDYITILNTILVCRTSENKLGICYAHVSNSGVWGITMRWLLTERCAFPTVLSA